MEKITLFDKVSEAYEKNHSDERNIKKSNQTENLFFSL